MRLAGAVPAGKLAIRAAHGFYQTDSDFLEWYETDTLDNVTWATAIETPDALHAALVDAYRGSDLSLERALLDLHSGRILGKCSLTRRMGKGRQAVPVEILHVGHAALCPTYTLNAPRNHTENTEKI